MGFGGENMLCEKLSSKAKLRCNWVSILIKPCVKRRLFGDEEKES